MDAATADARKGSRISRPWHATSVDDSLAILKTSADGLSVGEAGARLEDHGPNRLPSAPRPHPLMRFLAQFNNALIYFLMSAAVAAMFLGHVVDGAVIFLVVFVNAAVGFVQEGKAEQALDAIRDMIAPHAVVVRDGERHTIEASAIVPGDIVALEAGDKVPADLRLLRARGLTADESILTGESVPAEKSEESVDVNAPLGDRHSMLYSGTLIPTGQATGIAVATGADTEIGSISTMIGRVETLTTPLLAQINQFGRLFTGFAIAMAAGLFAFAVLFRNYDWVEALMVVVALAVGVVPEGLPAVITITLAIGVRRMASRNAVVRRLPAVETLGATSVICSDKTGTLTRNEMTARRVATSASVSQVSGSGYAPHGELAVGSLVQANDPIRDELIRAALLCNDAQLIEQAGDWNVLGDPMEGALVALAAKVGMHSENTREAWPRLDEIPFDAQHRFMATLNADPQGGRCILVKGAPERVLEMCERQRSDATRDSAVDLAYWHARIGEAADNGERVLGFAVMKAPSDADRLTFGMLERGLIFLGIAGFIDPPRDEAMRAVAECRSAGIAVKMITGDHNGTAVAIARQLAIADDPKALDGSVLDTLSDEELREVVERVSVFSRAAPEHKLRIVRALQANGHIVAMTGDGVNDAPAVRQADVGVAMGRKGTEAAKEAAEMVLVDDNFASIVAAVHEGRTVYDNIRKVIGWTLPTNGGEMLVVVLAIIFGLILPMTPVQILWINMVLTVTLGLVLAFEPAEPNVMQRPPRRRDAPILSRLLVWRIVFVAILFSIGSLGIFEYAMRQGLGERVARTMVVNTLVVMEIFYLFNIRYMHMTSFSLTGAAGTPAVLAAIGVVVAAQFGFTYLPFMHELFDSAPVRLADGMLIVLIGVITMVILEIEKVVMRRLWPATAHAG